MVDIVPIDLYDLDVLIDFSLLDSRIFIQRAFMRLQCAIIGIVPFTFWTSLRFALWFGVMCDQFRFGGKSHTTKLTFRWLVVSFFCSG
jgi:hypothetical protein